MVTFRSYTTPTVLMDLLIDRFNIPPPKDIDFSQFKVEKLDKIRLRIIQTLKYWIENFYYFDFDQEMKIKLNNTLKMINSRSKFKQSIRESFKFCDRRKEAIYQRNKVSTN